MASPSASIITAPVAAFPVDRLAFFLGGRDLEMATIRELLDAEPVGAVVDYRLAWGASAAAYVADIDDALRRGLVPVLVELDLAATPELRAHTILATDARAGDRSLGDGAIIVVDHHGPLAGADRPTSLEQVLDLLGARARRWSRWYELVAANDRGHVAEMLAHGATLPELHAVRAADRLAQGITSDEETEGTRAADAAERPCDGLTIVRLAHDRTAPVVDRLDAALGGPGYDTLLVRTPVATHVFADGATVASLNTTLPGGWYGGALPARGFWGRNGPGDDVEAFLVRRICGA